MNNFEKDNHNEHSHLECSACKKPFPDRLKDKKLGKKQKCNVCEKHFCSLYFENNSC